MVKYSKGGGARQYHQCRACNTARAKRYRASSQGRAAIRRAVTRYEAKNPERRRAWNDAWRQIPAQPCEVCGDPKADRHHDRPERTLDVIFLCRFHHKFRHRLMDEGIGLALEQTK